MTDNYLEATLPDTAAEAFLKLVAGRQGHFQLESGHHGELWLDLDALFAEPRRVAPLVALLTGALRAHAVAGVCGPLIGGAFLAQAIAAALDVEFAFTERAMPEVSDGLYRVRYRLPPAFAPRVRGRRIAIVDDVMSAGSAARGTYAELQAHGAKPAVVGALLVLGSTGEDFFAQQSVAVEAVARRPYRLWPPAACPLCDSGVPLEGVSVRNALRQAPEDRGRAAATTDFTVLSSPGERTPDRPPAAPTLPDGRLRGPRRDQR